MRYTKDGYGRILVDRGMGLVPSQPPALGNCFTGACADALAPYGWQAPPCGAPQANAAAAALQGQTQDALGNCFTGACADALAPYGWQAPPCGVPQANAAAAALQGQAQDALGNCFTGSCATALAPYGWSSPPCDMPPIEAAVWSVGARIVANRRGFLGKQ